MIDDLLLDYINSGMCYAFVGSGPSCEMGYPSWHSLALGVVEAVKRRTGKEEPEGYAKLLRQERYPDLFDRASKDIGSETLLEEVRVLLRPSRKQGETYGYLAKWPFAGYFTTNFDDELQAHLQTEGIYCSKLLNTATALRSITANTRDFVVKLHGELGSDELLLTSSQYKEFRSDPNRDYFRQKLEAVFAMLKICIVGFGLRDPNIEFILERAKRYASPANPIFMLATGLDRREASDLFDQYNIRVITYENVDGMHRQLKRILSTYDGHVVPRADVKLELRTKSTEDSEIAASLFIFTKLQLSGQTKEFVEDAAKMILLSALRRIPEGLEVASEAFAKAAPLARSCWQGMPDELFHHFAERLIASGLVTKSADNKISLTQKGIDLVDEGKQQHELLVDQFYGQATLDFQREFPAASTKETKLFREALDAALVRAFRSRGLEIANFIVHHTPVHVSDAPDLFRAFKKASASLPTFDMRYFFIKYATDLLLRPNALQKSYLWHLSQGYFAYHSLNLDPKREYFQPRLLEESVWVIDSSLMIPLFAKGSMNHKYALDLFARINKLGLAACTTAKIMEEVADHARWAEYYVRQSGDTSPGFLKAALAKGGIKQNLFIDGYIQSRVDGACLGFREYMTEIFGKEDPSVAIVRKLGEYNVRVLKIEEWPGFYKDDWGEIEECTQAVIEIRKSAGTFRNENQCIAEAEVYVALSKEAEGKYALRGEKPHSFGAFFLSQSGVLNAIRQPNGERKRLAWKPEAFYRFLLCFPVGAPSEDYLQQCMLSEYFAAGMQIIDQRRYREYFNPLIRQAQLTFQGVLAHYHTTVEEKFATRVEEAFDRTPDLEKPFFPLQMAAKTSQAAAQAVRTLREEAKLTAKERKELDFLRRKYAKKRKKGPRQRKVKH